MKRTAWPTASPSCSSGCSLAVDTAKALRERLFGRRVRIGVSVDATRFVHVAERAGARDVRIEGTDLSLGIDDPATATPALVRALVDAGALIRSVVDETPTLEDIYMRLVTEARRGRPGGSS